MAWCLMLIVLGVSVASGYVTVNSRREWRWTWHARKTDGIAGLFRNRPGIIPGRWGVWIWGLEIGSRNPGDPTGRWMKNHGLWPW